MGSPATPFFDYYEFLGVASDADPQLIRSAIQRWRERNNRDRVHPDLMRDIDRREARLAEAEQTLLNSARRQAYDGEYNRLIAQQDTGLLWLDPEFIFDADDVEPAQTVPGLARKLDDDWPRAIKSIKSEMLEQMLHYVGPRQPVGKLPRYVALEEEIERLRMALGNEHPYQMLESTIVLCDARIPRPDGRVDDKPLTGALLTMQPVRPDQPQTTRFRVQRATEGRGCLFGYVWLEDSWAAITSPVPTHVVIDKQEISGAYFELVGNGQVDITVGMQSSDLLQLSRPETHLLHIAFGLQPHTAHYHIERCTMAVEITPIPAKAAFEPALVRLPIARRGALLTAKVQLVNKGESPLNARQVRSTDADIGVEDSLAGTGMGGEVIVKVNTQDLPYGKSFLKFVSYVADGDIQSPQLQIVGELLPTAWQHIFRLQPARDRVTLAGAFALGALFVGPIIVGILSPLLLLFWLVSILVLTGGALGVTRIVARSIVRHIQASGDTTISENSIPWRPLLLGAGIGAAVIALVIALLPWDPWQKSIAYLSLGALLSGVWGFFFNEDLAIYPRKPDVVQGMDSKPSPLSAAWKAAAIVVGAIFFIAALVFDASLVGAFLLISIPIVIVLIILAVQSSTGQ